MKLNDGGPAFPFLPTQDRHGDTKGMSLRDWFAGMTLQGMLAGGYRSQRIDMMAEGTMGAAEPARVAYLLPTPCLRSATNEPTRKEKESKA